MKTWLVNDGKKVHCIQAEFLKTEWVGSECNIGVLVFQDITRSTLATFREWKWCKETPLATLSQEEMRSAAIDLRSWFAREKKCRRAETHKPPKVVSVEDTYEVVDAMTGVEELIYGFPPIKPEGTEEKK